MIGANGTQPKGRSSNFFPSSAFNNLIRNLMLADWPAVREEAARAHYDHTVLYLLGIRFFGDFLEESLTMLGCSCESDDYD